MLETASTCLFGLFCVAWLGGSFAATRGSGTSEASHLVSYLSGVFAWSLLYAAFRNRKKLDGGNPEAEVRGSSGD